MLLKSTLQVEPRHLRSVAQELLNTPFKSHKGQIGYCVYGYEVRQFLGEISPHYPWSWTKGSPEEKALFCLLIAEAMEQGDL